MKQIYFGLVLIGSCLAAQGQNRLLKALTDSTSSKEKKGIGTYFRPTAGINTYYRIYVGANYTIAHYTANEKGYKAKHTIGLNYSLTENSFHPYYLASFPQALSGWNLTLQAGYDQVRRVRYFGTGNETKRLTDDREFYKVRWHDQYARIGLDKFLTKNHRMDIGLAYNALKVLDKSGNFLSLKNGNLDPTLLQWQYYLSPQITYQYLQLSQELIPSKGIDFTADGSYNTNLNRSEKSFLRLATDVKAYLPLPKPFSILIHGGAATVTADPDFYQLNSIGGTNSLRGYDRYRFYGKTTFYNQNELRWIPYVKTSFYRGQLGLLLFYDQGRVWQPDETSTTLHHGYGTGIILAPFDKAVITVAYGISNEEKRFHLKVGKAF